VPLRLLHTSDWHLGKKLYKLERLPEQEYFLTWLSNTLEQEKIDVLLISGDIFDVPSPPAKAYKLYHDFLFQCAKLGVQVHIITGNHDGAKFIEAPKKQLAGHSIYLHTDISSFEDNSIHITKNGESLNLFALPYFRLNELASFTKKKSGDVPDLLDALQNLLDTFLLSPKNNHPSILMGHHLFGSFQLAGSEMGLAMSGIDTLPLGLFRDKIDYLALGHIHNYQLLKRESPKALYPGSPIPFRFGEKNEKRVEIIEVENNVLTSTPMSIPCFRYLYQLKLTGDTWPTQIEQFVSKSKAEWEHGKFFPLIEVLLKLESPKSGIIDLIREKLAQYELDFINIHCDFGQVGTLEELRPTEESIWNLSPLEMFQTFYLHQFPNEKVLPDELKEEFNELVSTLSPLEDQEGQS